MLNFQTRIESLRGNIAQTETAIRRHSAEIDRLMAELNQYTGALALAVELQGEQARLMSVPDNDAESVIIRDKCKDSVPLVPEGPVGTE